MRTILNDEYAPITSSAGFLEVPVNEAVFALGEWRNRLYSSVSISESSAPFPQALLQLEPLTSGGFQRELLVDLGEWTGYFNSAVRGTEAVSPIGVLSRALQCQGLAIDSTPHTIESAHPEKGRMGAVKFELFGPLPTDFLNYVRTVAVIFDGSRWVFEQSGTVQEFEDVAAYQSRSIRSRFTSTMLEHYCEALGLNAFDTTAYGRSFLIQSNAPLPPGGQHLSLAQAQEWLSIEPGNAERIPG